MVLLVCFCVENAIVLGVGPLLQGKLFSSYAFEILKRGEKTHNVRFLYFCSIKANEGKKISWYERFE